MAVELSREELLEKGVIKKYSPLEKKILKKVPEGRTTAVEVMRKLEEAECYFLKDYLGAIERLKEEGEIEMDIVEEKRICLILEESERLSRSQGNWLLQEEKGEKRPLNS